MDRQLLDTLKNAIEASESKQQDIAEIKQLLFRYSDKRHNPVDNVMWVNISQVEANDYNPNTVAKREMKLLYTSIKHDGYTQPIVTIYDPDKNKYVIVDGFHRYATMVYNRDIRELNHNMIPVVVINKGINDRMASTIRHNRARGKHSVDGMSNIVLNMLKNGWKDEDICNELGLEAEELIRLKYVTGYAKLYEKKEYGKAWITEHQLQKGKQFDDANPDANGYYANKKA